MIRFFLLIIILVSSAGSANDLSKFLGGRYLLSIGISKHQSPYGKLRYPAKDAKAIYDFFTKKEELEFQESILIQSSDHSGKISSLEEIREAFDSIESKAKKKSDVIVIYISSHGAIDYTAEGDLERYIVTENSDFNSPATSALPYQELMARFKRLPSKRKVLILDFCYSGTGKSGLSQRIIGELKKRKGKYFADPLDDSVRGEFILAASEGHEAALEDTRLGHGVYTYYLIKGFEQDLNGDGVTTITEAHLYARNKTDTHTNGKQTPSAIMHISGVDPIVVSGSKRKRKYEPQDSFIFSFRKGTSNLKLELDGKKYGPLGVGKGVPSGKSRLTLRDPETGSTLVDKVVFIDSNKEYSIESFFAPNVKWSFDLNLRNIQYTDSHTKRYFAPEELQGLSLRILRHAAWNIWDISLDLGFYPETEELIIFDNDNSLLQTRSMHSVDLRVGAKDNLYKLSMKDGSSKAEFFWGIGFSLQHVTRNRQGSSEKSLQPGLGANVGLVNRIPSIKARLGVEARYNVWNSMFSHGPNLVQTMEFVSFIGADL